jgi:hypothetical protein
MRGIAGTIALAALLAGCGGDDSKDAGKPATTPRPAWHATTSSLTCVKHSTIGIHRYSSKNDKGVENGVRALMTRGSHGGEVLTGQLGAVVIEYPSTIAAARAESDARQSRVLAGYVAPKQITAIEKTLLINYAGQGFLRRIVSACARHAERRPPLD